MDLWSSQSSVVAILSFCQSRTCLRSRGPIGASLWLLGFCWARRSLLPLCRVVTERGVGQKVCNSWEQLKLLLGAWALPKFSGLEFSRWNKAGGRDRSLEEEDAPWRFPNGSLTYMGTFLGDSWRLWRLRGESRELPFSVAPREAIFLEKSRGSCWTLEFPSEFRESPLPIIPKLGSTFPGESLLGSCEYLGESAPLLRELSAMSPPRDLGLWPAGLPPRGESKLLPAPPEVPRTRPDVPDGRGPRFPADKSLKVTCFRELFLTGGLTLDLEGLEWEWRWAWFPAPGKVLLTVDWKLASCKAAKRLSSVTHRMGNRRH